MVAERYGTDHHEFVVRPDAAEIFPQLVWHYNEPYADASAIPTYYLSQLARRHVTVALNGDAGDENFAGYRPLHHAATARSDSTGCRSRCAAPSAAWRALRPRPARSDSVMYRGRRWLRRLSDTPAGRYGRRVMIFDPDLKTRACAIRRFSRRPAASVPSRLLEGVRRAPTPTDFVDAAARRRRQLLPERLPAGEGGHRDDGARARGPLADARSRVHGVCGEPARRPQAARRHHEVHLQAGRPRSCCRPTSSTGRRRASACRSSAGSGTSCAR